jgi:hypothetical protein
MRKKHTLVLIFFAMPFILCAQSASKVSSDIKHSDPVKVTSWLLKEGSKIQDKEAARLKMAKGGQDFIRDELLNLYIEAKSSLEMQRAFYVYCFKELSTEEFSGLSKTQKAEIMESEERALRILEILSRLPPKAQEVKLNK